jgi:hypothetical protein
MNSVIISKFQERYNRAPLKIQFFIKKLFVSPYFSMSLINKTEFLEVPTDNCKNFPSVQRVVVNLVKLGCSEKIFLRVKKKLSCRKLAETVE